jgi:membrane-bound inhibitor of C-type lysozyme
MRQLSIAFALAVPLAGPLAACVQQAPQTRAGATIPRPAPDEATPAGIAYVCENRKEVMVVYAKNRASVTLDNKTWRMEYQGDGDGFRYSDAQAQWVGRDDLAALRDNSGTARPLAYNCRPTRRTT